MSPLAAIPAIALLVALGWAGSEDYKDRQMEADRITQIQREVSAKRNARLLHAESRLAYMVAYDRLAAK